MDPLAMTGRWKGKSYREFDSLLAGGASWFG